MQNNQQLFCLARNHYYFHIITLHHNKTRHLLYFRQIYIYTYNFFQTLPEWMKQRHSRGHRWSLCESTSFQDVDTARTYRLHENLEFVQDGWLHLVGKSLTVPNIETRIRAIHTGVKRENGCIQGTERNPVNVRELFM